MKPFQMIKSVRVGKFEIDFAVMKLMSAVILIPLLFPSYRIVDNTVALEFYLFLWCIGIYIRKRE